MRRFGTLVLLLFAILAASAHADDPSLTLRWHLDGLDDSGKAPDSSGSADPGTLYNAGVGITGRGRYTNGASFNGNALIANASVTIPATPTVVLWVRHAGVPSASATWLASGGSQNSCGNGTEAAYGLRMLANGNVVFSTRNGATTYADSPALGSLQVWDGLWHQVTGVYDGSRARLYVDGTEIGGGTVAPAIVNTNTIPTFALSRAYFDCGGAGTYVGDMDDLRLYNRNLSAAEIGYLAGSPGNVRPRDLPAPSAPQTGPVARYHLDTGTTVPDSSGGARNATTVAGTDQAAGVFGHALTLSNVGDGFLVPGSTALEPQQFTVSMWIKSSTILHDQVLIGKGALGCSNQAWGIRTDASGHLTFYVSLFDETGASKLLTTPVITKDKVFNGQWHEIAATYADGNATLSLDNTSAQRGALSPSPQGGAEEIDYSRYTQSSALSVGRYAASAAQCSLGGFQFYGDIDEVQLFDHVLDGPQLAALRDHTSATPLDPPAAQPTPNPAAEPEPGLSLKWHLDDLDQGQIPDTSGNHLNGTVDNVVPVDVGRWGHALTAPAGESPTSVGAGSRRSSLLETKAFSLLAWVKAPANDPGTIVSYGGLCGSTQPGIRLSGSDNGQPGLRFALLHGGSPISSTIYTNPGLDIWNDNWHLITATYDGTTMRLFVDGTQAGSLATTRAYSIGFTGLRIFDECFDNTHWHGTLDEVRFYRRVLTQDELDYLAGSLSADPPTLPIPLGPKNLTKPTLTGTPRIGQTITCVPGTFDGNPTFTGFTWERAPRGVTSDGDPSWAAIDNASGTTYTIQPADDGSNVRCRQVARNDLGQGEAVSRFLRADTDVPSGGGKPAVSGNPVRKNVLTCTPGTGWQHGPSFTYQWTRSGTAIDGETATTYRLKQRRQVGSQDVLDPNGDGGRDIGCTVVASNDLGSAGGISSDPVRAVDDVPLNIWGPGVEGLNTANPLASTLSCNRHTWIDDYIDKGAGYEDQFKWYRDGIEISGATASTYVPVATNLGRNISCAVAATNPAGTSGFSRGADTFIPLPGGSSAGKLDKVYRDNRNDPITMMATTDEYRDKAKALFKRLQDQQLDALKQSCATPSARKQEFPPFNVLPYPGIGVPPLMPALFPQQQCWAVNHLPQFILYTDVGYFYCPAGQPYGFGIFYSCNPLGLSVAPVNASTADALPATESDELAAVTPDEVLWDVDNDGRTDIACPGESPAIRGNFDIGRYTPHAIIVTKSSAQTGLFYNLTTSYDFPDTKAVSSGGVVKKGAKRQPLQPLWCRNSITPPADPSYAPCTSTGTIGRIVIKGNLCPMNVRAISDDALKNLPPDIAAMVQASANVINAAEAEREKAQPGYSEGERRRSLMARALPSPGDLDVAATAINTAASVAGLPAAQGLADNGGSQVEQKLDKVFGKGGTVDKAIPNFKPVNAPTALEAINTATGTVKVNGVSITPTSPKIPTLFVPSDVGQAIPGVDQMTILSQKATAVMNSPVDAAKQAADIPLQEGKTEFKSIVDDQVGKADKYLKDNIDLSKLGDKLNLGPFKLTGSSAKVELKDDGTAVLHAVAKLPGLTNAVAPPAKPDEKAGDPISIAVDLRGDLTGKITLQGLRLKVPKAYLVGVQLSGLDLTYNDKGLDVGGQITFPLSGNQGIEISHFRLGPDGEFLGINVAYLAGIGQGIQVAPGVFLTKIGGGFSAKPYEIKGQAAVAAGLPSAGGGCPTVGIDGGVTFHWNPVPLFLQVHGTVIIACIPLANLDFYADDTGWIKAHGDWGLNLSFVKLHADVNGEFVTSPSNIWQMDAKGTADFKFLPVDNITMKGVLSNRGVAACGSIRINAPDPFPGHVTLAAGAAIKFAGGHPPFTYPELLANIRAFTGCDINGYAPVHAVRSGRASTAAQTFTLPKGGSVLSIEGDGATPQVILTSPSGKRYDFSKAERGVIIDGALGAKIDSEDRTVVALPYGEAGTWKAEVADGSPAILRIQRADILAKPKVKARVTGKGAKRTLHYSVARMAGQSVTFVETARSGHQVLKTVTGGGSGKVTYRLGETRSPKRTIEAQVYQGGIPRARLEVAHYLARNPSLKRARVHLKRAGTAAAVSWSGVPTAVRYDVRIAYADGRRLLLEPKGKARAVKVPAVGKKGGVRVAVIAFTKAGRSSAGRARLKAIKAKHHKKKHKKHRK